MTWYITVAGAERSESLVPSAPSHLTSASTPASICLDLLFPRRCPRFISTPPRGDRWPVCSSRWVEPACFRPSHFSSVIKSSPITLLLTHAGPVVPTATASLGPRRSSPLWELMNYPVSSSLILSLKLPPHSQHQTSRLLTGLWR